jgi:hypothetical protein
MWPRRSLARGCASIPQNSMSSRLSYRNTQNRGRSITQGPVYSSTESSCQETHRLRFENIEVVETAVLLANCSGKRELLNLLGLSVDACRIPMILEHLPQFYSPTSVPVIAQNISLGLGLLSSSMRRWAGLVWDDTVFAAIFEIM